MIGIGRRRALLALPIAALLIVGAAPAVAQPGITCNLLGPKHPCEPCRVRICG
jgi:hypothetical protein